MTAARDALIARIQKLAALANCAGATEAEALSAATKMQTLIADYNVTRDELSLRRDAKGCVCEFIYIANADKSNWQRIHDSIAKLFGCKSYRTRSQEDLLGLGFKEWIVTIHFFGLPEDVAAAKGFMIIMEQQCIAEIAKWNKTPDQRRMQKDFELGLFERLRDRILALIPPPVASSSRGLIVLKDQLVSNEWAQYLIDQDLKMRKNRGTSVADEGAFTSGQSAANRVDLQQQRVARTMIGQ